MKKEITYKNRKFFYEIETSECGEYGASICYTTNFFLADGIGKRKKYWLFGPEITYTKYKKIFQIEYNIESPRYSKSEVRDMIEKKVKIFDRAEEIKKGKVI